MQLDGAILHTVAFIASVGAALAMIPPAMAVDAVKSGIVPETMMLNAQEVLNVGASIFNTQAEVASVAHLTTAKTHVRLAKLLFGSADPALLKSAQTASVSLRLDTAVTTPGYPEGKLALLAIKKA